MGIGIQESSLSPIRSEYLMVNKQEEDRQASIDSHTTATVSKRKSQVLTLAVADEILQKERLLRKFSVDFFQQLLSAPFWVWRFSKQLSEHVGVDWNSSNYPCKKGESNK